MARVLSALVLLPVVVGVVWFGGYPGLVLLAVVASVLGFLEYVTIAAALGARVPKVTGALGVAAACLATNVAGRPSDVVMNDRVPIAPGALDAVVMLALVVAGTRAVAAARLGPQALVDTAATLFPMIYLGVPLGALALTGDSWSGGREAVLLLMLVIVVSDSAQYYTGRAFGRRPLAPVISPKKTVEGAIGGLIFGTLAMIAGGRWVFGSPIWVLALAGAAIAVLGMIGDLFESLLKRSAGVKDSGALIPGHGGILDRIDSWLFAAPAYYLFVRLFATRA